MRKIKTNKKKLAKMTGIVAIVFTVIGVIKYFTPEEYTEDVIPDDGNTDDYDEFDDPEI